VLYRIVYMSRATDFLTDLEVENLATQAGERNEAHSINGLLLFDGRRFMQAIEGDKNSVQTLMERIGADDRHESIVIVSEGRAARRKFSDWSLCYKRVGEGRAAPDYLNQVKAQMAAIPNPALQASFIGFAVLAYNDAPTRKLPTLERVGSAQIAA
jgi:hypothetical protein